MPEMHFRVKWPSGHVEDCYSPSYIIEEYLKEGAAYELSDFVARMREALSTASERVRAKYGFACSSALDQLGAIEERASLEQAKNPGRVAVLAFVKHPPREARAKKPEHFPVMIVGGGQAGLSMSYLLKQRSISHVVLEGKRIANAWRNERWDNFCLVTPNWQCRLPGHSYIGDDPQGFMGKDAIVEYVESYAARFQLPVREGVRVTSVTPREGGGFEIETSAGAMTADHVVVATGGYHYPRKPSYAASIPIFQLHSSEYRNAAALPPGAVLVVGTGQSGCQIAEDLHLEGRKVHLAVGSAPRCARRHRGRDVVAWLDEMGHYDLPIDQQKNPDELRERANHYVTGRAGGHDLDLRRFALEGMKLYGPATSFEAGKLRFAPKLREHLDHADDVYRSINRAIDVHIAQRRIDAPPEPEYAAVWEPDEEPSELDLEAAGITTIIWATGFVTDFSWVKLPVLDTRGRVQHQRGVTTTPGLYFLGLPWLHTWGSGRFSGVKADAEHLLARISSTAVEAPAREQPVAASP